MFQKRLRNIRSDEEETDQGGLGKSDHIGEENETDCFENSLHMIYTSGWTKEKTKNIINQCSVKKTLLNSTVQFINREGSKPKRRIHKGAQTVIPQLRLE